MSTSSWSFRLNDSQKDKVNRIIERVSKEKSLTKRLSLIHIFDAYENNLIGNESGEHIETNARDALHFIDCDYLEYSDKQFWCLEKAHKTKKKDMIGVEPKSVKRFCTACKQGKADLIANKIKEERRKESFKRIDKFLKQFMIITEKGFIAETYMCFGNALEGDLICSRDGKSLRCPLADNDIVQIKDVCMNALNPRTGLTPCKYLATYEHLVQITKEDIEKMGIELPQIEYIEPEEPTSHTLSKEYRKEVDAEYKIQEEEDKLNIEKDEIQEEIKEE